MKNENRWNNKLDVRSSTLLTKWKMHHQRYSSTSILHLLIQPPKPKYGILCYLSSQSVFLESHATSAKLFRRWTGSSGGRWGWSRRLWVGALVCVMCIVSDFFLQLAAVWLYWLSTRTSGLFFFQIKCFCWRFGIESFAGRRNGTIECASFRFAPK